MSLLTESSCLQSFSFSCLHPVCVCLSSHFSVWKEESSGWRTGREQCVGVRVWNMWFTSTLKYVWMNRRNPKKLDPINRQWKLRSGLSFYFIYFLSSPLWILTLSHQAVTIKRCTYLQNVPCSPLFSPAPSFPSLRTALRSMCVSGCVSAFVYVCVCVRAQWIKPYAVCTIGPPLPPPASVWKTASWPTSLWSEVLHSWLPVSSTYVPNSWDLIFFLFVFFFFGLLF